MCLHRIDFCVSYHVYCNVIRFVSSIFMLYVIYLLAIRCSVILDG